MKFLKISKILFFIVFLWHLTLSEGQSSTSCFSDFPEETFKNIKRKIHDFRNSFSHFFVKRNLITQRDETLVQNQGIQELPKPLEAFPLSPLPLLENKGEFGSRKHLIAKADLETFLKNQFKAYKKENPLLYYLLKAGAENKHLTKTLFKNSFNIDPEFWEALERKLICQSDVSQELISLWKEIDQLGLRPLYLKKVTFKDFLKLIPVYQKEMKVKNFTREILSEDFHFITQNVACEMYPCFYYLRYFQQELSKLKYHYQDRESQQSRQISPSAEQTKKHDLKKLNENLKAANFMISKVNCLLDKFEHAGLTGQYTLPSLDHSEDAS